MKDANRSHEQNHDANEGWPRKGSVTGEAMRWPQEPPPPWTLGSAPHFSQHLVRLVEITGFAVVFFDRKVGPSRDRLGFIVKICVWRRDVPAHDIRILKSKHILAAGD